MLIKLKKAPLLLVISLLFAAITSVQQIPAIKLASLDGAAFNSGDFNTNGKPIVLSFWATWCIPCINELSNINDKYDSWKKEANFDFYAISQDDSRTIKRVQPLVNGKNWDFTVLLDKNQDLKRELNLMNIPYTIIVKDGKIIYRQSGYVLGDEEILFKAIKDNQ